MSAVLICKWTLSHSDDDDSGLCASARNYFLSEVIRSRLGFCQLTDIVRVTTYKFLYYYCFTSRCISVPSWTALSCIQQYI